MENGQNEGSSSADRIICNGCKLTLEENGTASDSVVVSFGNSLWHVDCFRCAKCRNLVEHDTNLLLLSDGSPVCENCSYICSVCKLPISNEAIVTGEESYHADCFRCRSCSNRIEELIFAKTSQGIYCMTCHNERVTRSRRHAEAKRNKSTANTTSSGTKKERDRERADKPNPNRSKPRNLIAPQKSPQPANSSSFPLSATDPALNSNHSNHHHHPHQHHHHHHLPGLPSSHPDPSNKPLSSLPNTPRSPHPPLKTNSSSNSLLNSYLSHQPGLASSHGSSTVPHKESYSLDHGQRPLQTSRSTSPILPTRRRGGSASSVHHPSNNGHSAALHPHEPINPHHHASSQAAQNTITRPSTADGKGPSSKPLQSYFTSSAINRSYESSPHLPANRSHPQAEHGRTAMDRNRPIAPRADPVDPKLRTKHRSVSLSSFDDITLQNQNNLLHPGPGSDTQHHMNLASDPTAFSYNDIFSSLDHNPDGQAEDPTRLMSQLELSAIDIEDLLATPTAVDPRDPRVSSTAGRPEIDEISKKVRESISLSRDKPNQTATGLGFDVGLVEKLLWELDETKERMKALQDEYHQMKRVSRSAYEGFSLARQNYDTQVSQRQDAEAKMKELKTRMIEQASRLKEMDSLKTLEFQSEELKDSVSGLQKHVSQLAAERDFRIAEVEALNDISDQVKKTGELPSGESLSERFDQLRKRYLHEVQDLASERDRLKEEVAHLASIRESQAKELASLNQRQDALTEMNATAVKRLEETRSTASRILARHPAPASTIKPSLNSPTTMTGGQSSAHDSDFPIQMSPEVNIATTRKFKWGKSHTHKGSTAASSRQLHHAKNASSISTPESAGINNGAAHNDHPANSSGTTNPPTNSSSGNLSSNNHANASAGNNNNSSSSNVASSSIVGLRPHNFQPVSALRPVRCDYCGDKLWGLAEVRCTACGSYSHTKCAANFFGCHASSGPSNPSHGTMSSSLLVSGAGSIEEDVESVLFGNDLVNQARAENKLVPSVVTKCIEAVEEQGLNFEGIYRKTGGMSSVKMIQNCFERGQSMNFNDLDKFNDISAITSTLKNYFRQLPNPLFTFELHEAFVTVATMAQENIRLEALERVIYQLPAVHFETLKVLMNHLSKIEKQSEHNKMTSQNLGVIFGPTLLRSANPNRQFSDMPFTAKIVELTVLNRPLLFRKPFGTNPSSSTPSPNSASPAAAPSLPASSTATMHPSLPRGDHH
ncbi:hypothetical protein PtB15_17B366 [Puccinia triticina]|nr:hypothetical protein PtB15_17B366 [Puccinia triticina]